MDGKEKDYALKAIIAQAWMVYHAFDNLSSLVRSRGWQNAEELDLDQWVEEQEDKFNGLGSLQYVIEQLEKRKAPKG